MKSPENQRRHVSEYVESQANEKVQRAEKIASEKNLGNRYDIWDVETDSDRYWVITDPTNLYSQKEFPSMDYALSFHIGVTSRVLAAQHTDATDEEIWRTPKTWRQWEQAHVALDDAVEAEDFQGVGVRCREVLITLVEELDMKDKTAKKADVKAQLSYAYNQLAPGGSLSEVRGHLKATADATWPLVGWLTHHKNADYYDARYVMQATEQLMLNTLELVVRKEKPAPKRCPACQSYQVVSDFRSELMYKVEHPYVELCESCGWEGPVPAE